MRNSQHVPAQHGGPLLFAQQDHRHCRRCGIPEHRFPGVRSQYLLVHAGVLLSLGRRSGCGGVIGNALMSNWFERCRGRAFGIANLGTSLSGAILPFVALLLLEFFSLEMTAAIMGLPSFSS